MERLDERNGRCVVLAVDAEEAPMPPALYLALKTTQQVAPP